MSTSLRPSTNPRYVTLLLGALTVLIACVIARPEAAAAQGLKIGFADGLFTSKEGPDRSEWLGRAPQTGASIIRLNVRWAVVAPKKPPAGFEAANPAAVGYEWATLDAAVREATADDLKIFFTVYQAPTWAEGGQRPKNAEPGSWEPSAGAFGEFAQALAGRYNGTFPDPSDPGSSLPAVNYYEAWNEPNLSVYLAPQWDGGENRGSNLYRGLLNSFYAGVKRGSPRAKVLAGSLAPFGEEPGGTRTRPVLFLRNLLCLEGGVLRKTACPEPARFDILSDHPIAVGPPTQSATSPLDVTTPDLGRLTKVLEKAEQTKRALPAGKKPLWVTEFWYDTNPPDPNGLSLATQARWYEQDLYLFWKQGAQVAIALQLRDSPEGKSYALTYQSGAYFLDGSPKPSATAFKFPFVAQRTGPFKAAVWGIAPHGGKVRVQAFRGGSWKTLATLSSKGLGRPFTGEIDLLRFAKLRAVIGGDSSLPWLQR
ncbi:MAG TPA: hypothetical protein VH853_20020 [Polyangia bacterium]|jgi:hypothetical protein|nr:hypothetical protein [Polyangia bacterium]